jgi:ABC-type transporter MlaC component
MKKIFTLGIVVIHSFTIFSQEIPLQDKKKDSTTIYYLIRNDSLIQPTLELEEVIVTGNKLSKNQEDRKKFAILQRRVIKVYPYAKIAADNLLLLEKNMNKLSSDRDKKKYFKIVENYLTNEFEAQLKKLSKKDGQILIKLISRQTGKSTYELIRDLKGGWKAFWSSQTAKVFSLDLKAEYAPYDKTEDFLIESILISQFKQGKLTKQEPAKPIDHLDLANYWKERVRKAKEAKALKEEE